MNLTQSQTEGDISQKIHKPIPPAPIGSESGKGLERARIAFYTWKTEKGKRGKLDFQRQGR